MPYPFFVEILMSDLKEQLVKLGKQNKSLRPHIRPVLSSLEKSSARGGWDERLLGAKENFVKDTFDVVKRLFPEAAAKLGVEVNGYRMTGTYEMTVDVTMADIWFSVAPKEEGIWAAVGHPRKEEQLTLPESMTPAQVAEELVDALVRIS